MSGRSRLSFGALKALVFNAGKDWVDDKAPRLAAALSYYTAFSLPPLLVLLVGLAGLIYDTDVVQERLVGEIAGLVGDEPGGGVDGDDAPGFHDRDAIAEDFGLFHVMGGQDDRFAALARALDEGPEGVAGLGVEAGGRLVEEEDLGVVDQGGGEGDALLLAAGEGAEEGAGAVGEIDAGEECGDGEGAVV